MLEHVKRLRSVLSSAGSRELGPGEVNVRHVVDAIAEGTVQIVDVREEHEWATGRIAGAIHLPLGDLPLRASELNPRRPVIAVCRSGRRSLVAAHQLTALGFVDVTSLAGGIIAWRDAGQPAER